MVILNKDIHNLTNKQLLSNTGLIIFICLFFASNTLKAQQEPMYSQYMLNMIQINPAYAGNRAVDNFTTLYRKQWVGIEGAPTTASLSWDRRQESSNVGYGLQVYNDKLGLESSSGLQAFYSYRLPFRNSCLTFGLSGGIINYNANFSQAITNEGADDLFKQDVNKWLPTVGLGALYATEHWYVGLSVPALLQTKVYENNYQVTSGANNHYFLTGGYIFETSEVLKLKPSILMKAVQGSPLEYDFNLNAWINDRLALGVSYRTGDAIIGLFEIQISPEIHLGYAYDYTISNLKTYSSGTHELMLRVELNGPKMQRLLSPRYY
jgi:type IX secretion system PorP/SprF family membrane protein